MVGTKGDESEVEEVTTGPAGTVDSDVGDVEKTSEGIEDEKEETSEERTSVDEGKEGTTSVKLVASSIDVHEGPVGTVDGFQIGATVDMVVKGAGGRLVTLLSSHFPRHQQAELCFRLQKPTILVKEKRNEGNLKWA